MNQQEIQNQEKIKALLVEQLKKTPVIQVACEKLDIARSTFYRWRDNDPEFAKAVNESMNQGTEFVSDFAESRLIEAIRDKNLKAIMFWLKAHSNRYSTKLEINGRLNVVNEPLSEEQQNLIKKALSFSGLINTDKQT
jgi:hypothetical protein